MEVIWDKMKRETFDKIFEISYKCKDKLVTSVLLDYFLLENQCPFASEEDLSRHLEKEYELRRH